MLMQLPRLGFGGAPIAGLLDTVDECAAMRTLDAALAAGIRYFDTAPFYGFGLSERRIGDAIRFRDGITLSTKVGRLLVPGLPPEPATLGWPGPLPFHPKFDYTYDGIMRSYEDSLQRLGRDRIEILFLHDIGAFTHTDPGEEVRHFRDAMAGGYVAMDELRRSGAVSAIGIGVNETAVSLRALEHGDWDLILLAGRYTLLEQGALDPLFIRCRDRGVRIVIGGPFNSGILVGGTTWDYAEASDTIRARVTDLSRVCASHGVPLPAAALQFPLAHPQVVSVIPGTRTPAEFAQLLEWFNLEIPPALWAELRSEQLLHPQAPTPG